MSRKIGWNAVLAVGMVAASGLAVAQNPVPDAQVEANVLKALASAPELANQQITTRTVYGTVTLSGTVNDEAARTKAENLAANANGVKKVVDELQLGSEAAAAQTNGQTAALGQVLLSDGTYGPAPTGTDQNLAQPAPGSAPAAMAQRNNPEADQARDQEMQQQNGQPGAQPGMNQPNGQQPNMAANGQYPPNGQYPSSQYPPSGQYPRPMTQYPGYPQYPAYPNSYPQQQGYGQPGQQPIVGGQVAGQPVTIPTGALLRVRINRTLASNRTQPGTTFDGVVVNDVVANGLVAIPRGATVQGKVIDAKSSGALTGRGEMTIQLTQVTLGGKVYPLVSDVWGHHGSDKTTETVNKTAGLGALGAIVGAVAAGGKGAAIGGGVGAAAGLGSSAASGNGQVYIPAESIVTFHTAGETQVATVSEQEMQRLAYAAGPNVVQPPLQRVYRVYPGYYPPPGYYPYPQQAGYPNQ